MRKRWDLGTRVLSIVASCVATLAFSGHALAYDCLIDFNAQSKIDQFTDRAMASQFSGAWRQFCRYVEVNDTLATIGANYAATELPFSNATYDVMLWDGGGKGGCVLPASGANPAATSTFGNLGGNGFGCDPTKAIYWNADTYPRYISTHVPGQPANWVQPISLWLIGVTSHFDLASFTVVHGKVDLCTRAPNSNSFVKPAGHTNIGVGVHNVYNVFDVFEVRFASAGKPCEDSQTTGIAAGVDDIRIQWN